MKQLFSRQRSQRGQGMMEYVIIVALIAVAAIGVYSAFGKTVRNQTAGLAKEMSGNDGGSQITQSGAAATVAATRGDSTKGLGRYNNENDQGAGNGGTGGNGGGTGTGGQ